MFISFQQTQAGVKLPLCNEVSSMDLFGKTISLWALVDQPLPDDCTAPATNALNIDVTEGPSAR